MTKKRYPETRTYSQRKNIDTGKSCPVCGQPIFTDKRQLIAATRTCSATCRDIWCSHYTKIRGIGSLGSEWKTTIRSSVHPTTGDLQWAAGFLEGEGSFSSTSVKAAQVNKEPLLRLQRLFGGSLCLRHHSNPQHSDHWNWEVCGSRARGVALTLYVLLTQHRRNQVRSAFKGRVP